MPQNPTGEWWGGGGARDFLEMKGSGHLCIPHQFINVTSYWPYICVCVCVRVSTSPTRLKKVTPVIVCLGGNKSQHFLESFSLTHG